MVLWYLLYALMIGSSTFVHSYHLRPRESTRDFYDPFIICEGAGPTHVEGLPRTYSEHDYDLNLYLCSVAHGIPGHNVGCACSRASGNVQCHQELADPDLWGASYRSMDQEEIDDARDQGFTDGVVPFWEYCWVNCLCGDAETASQRISNSTAALSVLHRFRIGQLARQRAGTLPHNSFTGGATVTTGGGPNRANTPSDPMFHTQCGNNCTSNNDCTAPASPTGTGEVEKGSSCTCRAQSSTYQPGSGTVAYVAACLIDMATGGKREEHLPCPCNSTYVSHECCGSKDGWVWEAPEQKLGELVR